ncbi:hypothetical protein ACV3QH_08560 [Clostridium perfringens]
MKFKSLDTEMYFVFGNNHGRLDWENKLHYVGIKMLILSYISL